jgi:nitroreductase
MFNNSVYHGLLDFLYKWYKFIISRFLRQGDTMFKDLILNNRSYRRFDSTVSVSEEILLELIELARLSPSGANRQPLKYYLSSQPELNQLIFPHLAWAAYLTDWPGPEEEERPTAYIVILGDKKITTSFGCDHGIAAQSILLGAVEKGFGGCMIGSIDRKSLKKALNLSDNLEILLVIALGKPLETVILESVGADGVVKYWRDDQQQHHVPKRSLEELIVSSP